MHCATVAKGLCHMGQCPIWTMNLSTSLVHLTLNRFVQVALVVHLHVCMSITWGPCHSGYLLHERNVTVATWGAEAWCNCQKCCLHKHMTLQTTIKTCASKCSNKVHQLHWKGTHYLSGFKFCWEPCQLRSKLSIQTQHSWIGCVFVDNCIPFFNVLLMT